MGAGAQNPYAQPVKPVVRGTKGEVVRWLQWELRDSGYSTILVDGRPKDLDVDGEFGPVTLSALWAFQKDHSLAVTGVCDTPTIKLLIEESSPAPVNQASGRIIDVSHHQGRIDWSKLAAETGAKHIDFVFIRVQDNTVLDRELARNIAGAEKYLVPYGNYAFFRAHTPAEAREEAELFFRRAMAANAKPRCWVLDVETSGKIAPTPESVKAWCQRMRQLVGDDALIGIYIGHHIYVAHEAIVKLFGFQWIPRWNGWKVPPAYKCALWQGGYTKVSGTGGTVDYNKLMPGYSLSHIMR